MNILRSIFGLGSKAKDQNPVDTQVPKPKQPGGVNEVLRPLLTFMEGMAESLCAERIDELTLREVVKRFVEGKPESPESLKGALFVKPHREGQLVLWTFLDSTNNVIRGKDGAPLGCKAICAVLDEELTTMLAEHELLIVE